MSEFSALMTLIFGWLPHDLFVPVVGLLAVAFLILMIKILVALVQIISKLIFLFV